MEKWKSNESNPKNALAREQNKVAGVQVLLPPAHLHLTQIPSILFHAFMNGNLKHLLYFSLIMFITLPGKPPLFITDLLTHIPKEIYR